MSLPQRPYRRKRTKKPKPSWNTVMRDRARELRAARTSAEHVLREHLKTADVGTAVHFQAPFKFYIPDFFLPHAGLVVEVDGGYHDTPEQRVRDAKRTKYFGFLGIVVLRFLNEAVLADPVGVVGKIRDTVQARLGLDIPRFVQGKHGIWKRLGEAKVDGEPHRPKGDSIGKLKAGDVVTAFGRAFIVVKRIERRGQRSTEVLVRDSRSGVTSILTRSQLAKPREPSPSTVRSRALDRWGATHQAALPALIGQTVMVRVGRAIGAHRILSTTESDLVGRDSRGIIRSFKWTDIVDRDRERLYQEHEPLFR